MSREFDKKKYREDTEDMIYRCTRGYIKSYEGLSDRLRESLLERLDEEYEQKKAEN